MRYNYRGGILLTVLLFIFLFSFLFTLVIEDFKATQYFSKNTKDYYAAKIMVSMFLFEVKQEQHSLEKEGQQVFSEGVLNYKCDERTIYFTVELQQQSYTFQENYSIAKND
ncbi:competence type IV pilus minor pilin ComGG [Enterococcus sp. 5H]|uniref:competence type IV pilus minor pilin ComGG n=1 Tax=Enterococcus sp. 5H TaxID=1229490 RepID=UPI0023037FA2|nr:competence type IV pilus minor pilin ComGG [Enterococcus sp. 5H]MDA9471514.1 hypothetical protein [Enterococcus sp. 5H]